ncbi:hypothetical protein [Lactococcus lactis]|uniref:hypothetical protein n=1 Tax=Lactococcus lactis TaxID=1358 RepID=UPI0033948E8A
MNKLLLTSYYFNIRFSLNLIDEEYIEKGEIMNKKIAIGMCGILLSLGAGIVCHVNADVLGRSSINVSSPNNKANSEDINLVKNGDFSQGFDDWVVQGKPSIKINENGNYIDMNNGMLSQMVSIDPGSVYKVSFSGFRDRHWVQGSGNLLIGMYNNSGHPDFKHVEVTESDTWATYSTIINDSEKKYSSVDLIFRAGYLNFINFTNVRIEKIG